MPLLTEVPFFSQLDNRFNPYGSCNVTSIAMCLWFYGIRGNGSQKQLEDQLYKDLLDTGRSRHNPQDLEWLVNCYQPIVKDVFNVQGTIKDITNSIDNGNPVVLHGYFTRSGHIIVIVGYKDNVLIVNDPYGEYWKHGYDTSIRGERLEYSFGMIAALCSPESKNDPSNLWIHCFSKGSHLNHSVK